MSLPGYPKYRDSGVEWLGIVPEHWATPPLYLRYEAVLGKMLDEKRLTRRHLLPYVRNTDVQWDRVNVEDLPMLDIEPDEFQRFTLKAGDILICEGGEVGRTAIWRGELEQCAFQKAIHRLRPIAEKESRRFFYYCMSFAAATGVFLAEGNPNTIPHLTGEKLRRYRFPTPPYAEQSSIAEFLDRETAKIDALVGEQRRLIELLREKRQAVISHAVTKGLNPHGPMKPSGIEWLGSIPARWSMHPLKRIVQPKRRITYGIVQPGEPDPLGRYMIRGKDYSDGWCQPDDIFRVSTDIETPYVRSRMRHNDLIMTIVGASVGTVAVIPDWLDGANITQTSARIAIDPAKADPEFVCYALQSVIGHRNLERNVYGSAQPRLNLEHVEAYVTTVPPLEEQRQIVKFLRVELARWDALTAEAQRAISLLQERRTALISAAVTGKIDVRGLADLEAA